MKRFLLGIMTVILMISLVGCSSDPVKNDLEEYQKVMAASWTKYAKDNGALQAKIQKSATDPEAMKAVYGEMAKLTEGMQKDLSNFKPKSEEMKKIVVKLNSGYGGMTKVYQAIATGDMAKMAEMTPKLKEMAEAHEELVKLAKEKKVEWKLQ